MGQNAWLGPLTAMGRGKKASIPIPHPTKADIELLKEIIEVGQYRPVIDRTYTFDDVIEATRYVDTQQKTGNVVLKVVP
jgi:NADPH:quinone reductase-like Zn-dependent oxidoreductase